MSGKRLHLAAGLLLPTDAVTQTFAFLGRRGSGKTYGATKLAELLHGAGAQIIALDPVGVWWGLRLAADGKSAGLEIPVFGGLHGDLPLEPTAGALIADVVVDRGISAVIDVSQMISSEQARFATAFATRLFERRKQQPSAMHLFIEECQEFIPQNAMEGEKHMVHAFQRLAKLGRNFGIGISLISQRPQEVAKKVLNMTECMLAFQMTGPQERKAISLYVDERGADDDVIDVLPKLKVGHAHVWSPQWLEVSADVHIEPKLTFDASSTPKMGAKAQEARPLAPIDLEKLKVDMAATIERAKADDPKLLRAEIARLKKEFSKPPAPIGKSITHQADIDRAMLRGYAEAMKAGTGHRKKIRALADELQRRSAELQIVCAALDEIHATAGTLPARGTQVIEIRGALNEKQLERAIDLQRPVTRPTTDDGEPAVSKAQQRILDALAAFEQLGLSPVKNVSAAFFAGYTENGHFNNSKGALRAAGLVDYPSGGTIALTDAGRAIANAGASVGSLGELHALWLGKLSASKGKLLQLLIAHYPNPIGRAALADLAGYTENGHFNNMLGHLRTLGAVDYPAGGQVVATDVLFPEGLA